MAIKVEVSFGEYLDKLTILQIKSERIKDPGKLENVNRELALLQKTWQQRPESKVDLSTELRQLKAVNEKLWEIEDNIRDKERNSNFDTGFIELARAVYFTNDERARIKRVINEKLGSELIEEKSYSDY